MSHIRFFLISNVVALCLVVIEGVHWAKDGPKFACRFDGCNASYTTKYNLISHLWMHYNVTMELGKPGRSSTREKDLRHQDHTDALPSPMLAPTWG
jgi:hypothetical protein